MYKICFTRAAEKYLKKVKEKGLKLEYQLALQEISRVINSDTKSNAEFCIGVFLFINYIRSKGNMV